MIRITEWARIGAQVLFWLVIGASIGTVLIGALDHFIPLPSEWPYPGGDSSCDPGAFECPSHNGLVTSVVAIAITGWLAWWRYLGGYRAYRALRSGYIIAVLLIIWSAGGTLYRVSQIVLGPPVRQKIHNVQLREAFGELVLSLVFFGFIPIALSFFRKFDYCWRLKHSLILFNDRKDNPKALWTHADAKGTIRSKMWDGTEWKDVSSDHPVVHEILERGDSVEENVLTMWGIPKPSTINHKQLEL